MPGIGDGAVAGNRGVKALLLVLAIAGPVPPRPCLNTAEAEALVAVALPEVLRQTGVRCAARLPAASLLRQANGAWLRRYDQAADGAWPAARLAIVKLSDPAMSALLDSRYARPLLASLAAPMIVARIGTEDCATIDRMATLLAPLPPHNLAGLVVAGLDRARLAKPVAGASNPIASLPLCPVETR